VCAVIYAGSDERHRSVSLFPISRRNSTRSRNAVRRTALGRLVQGNRSKTSASFGYTSERHEAVRDALETFSRDPF